MLYRAPVDTSLVTEGVTLVKHRLLLLLLFTIISIVVKKYCSLLQKNKIIRQSS